MAVRIFQIYYSDETRQQLDPGFLPLDNYANERPDWREYWPIRKYFADSQPEEGSYYGFLSPKFKAKTHLEASTVRSFVEEGIGKADVFLFSPFVDVGSFFLNVFQQGDAFHPGLLTATQRFLDEIGVSVNLRELVTDSTDTCYCNYVIGNDKFWNIWLEITGKLFEACETGPSSDWQLALLAPAFFRSPPAPLKVFVMERMVSLVLSLHPELKVRAYCPFCLPLSNVAVFASHPREALVCDALKIAYRAQKYPHYLQAFAGIRKSVHG